LKKRSSRSKTVPSKTASSQWPISSFLILLAGMILLGLLMLQEDNFRWLGSPFSISNPYWNFLMMAALAAMGYGFYRMPAKTSGGDLSKWTAYSILAVIFGAAAYLRFVRADQAYSGYWADPAIEIADVCEMVQKHVFFVIFPEGGREPLFSYCAALIWWLFPSLKALFVQRLTANVINLAAIWILYRLGREVSGKRSVGIILAGLAAATKGLLLLNLCGMRVNTLTFGIALMFWAQVKLFKKMNLKHFLFWGLAISAGLYTYTVIRLWVPFLVLTTLVFGFWSQKKQSIHSWIKAVCAVFLIFYLSFYLDSMLGMFSKNFISVIWGSYFPAWVIWQCLLGALLIYGYRVSGKNNNWLCAWGLGFLVVSILGQPIALHPEVAGRITEQSLLPKTLGGWFSAESIQTISTHGKQAFMALFSSGSGRSDMNILGDCFFDFQASVLILTGLVYAAIRPAWMKSFIVLSAITAILPYWLTSDLHMAKISGTAVPLLLLAALALGHLIDILFQSPGTKRSMGFIFVLTLCLFWGWEVRSSYQRVYDKWWWEVWNDDVCVSRAVDKELPEKRVYLIRIPDSVSHSGQFFDANTQSILHDNEPTYLLQPANVIDVRPGETRKDVAVIFSPLMTDLVKKIKTEFPKATWEPTWQYYQKSHDETPFLYSVVIPADQISEKSGKLFSFHVADSAAWCRKYYLSRLCFREGVVESEDMSLKLNPTPLSAASHAVGAEGDWTAPEDGNYTFILKGGDESQVCIDGHHYMTLYSGGPGRTTAEFYMKKGSHHIRIAAYLILGRDFPLLSVENTKLNYKTLLGS